METKTANRKRYPVRRLDTWFELVRERNRQLAAFSIPRKRDFEARVLVRITNPATIK